MNDASHDPEKPYHVERRADRWLVLFEGELEICKTGHELSAHHYATLLNQAYRRGYKAGKKAKGSAPK